MATRTKRNAARTVAEFGARLRALREARGLTQRDLAERIETQEPQISRYEGGTALPHFETLIALGEALHVGLDELILGRDGGRDAEGIRDVRLLELVCELETLERRFIETAIAVLDALVVQGSGERRRKR